MNSIKIVRSKRRKKTIQARIIDDTYCIYIPDGLSKEIEDKWITKMVKQLKQQEKQKQLNSDNRLKERADRLNTQYFDGSLEFTIQFVVNQHKRFGSCSPHSKRIRISNRISTMPVWVQNYVILHE